MNGNQTSSSSRTEHVQNIIEQEKTLHINNTNVEMCLFIDESNSYEGEKGVSEDVSV